MARRNGGVVSAQAAPQHTRVCARRCCRRRVSLLSSRSRGIIKFGILLRSIMNNADRFERVFAHARAYATARPHGRARPHDRAIARPHKQPHNRTTARPHDRGVWVVCPGAPPQSTNRKGKRKWESETRFRFCQLCLWSCWSGLFEIDPNQKKTNKFAVSCPPPIFSGLPQLIKFRCKRRN